MATKFHIDKSITWWVTSPPQRKKSTNSTFNKDVVDFVGHTSLHSYSRMVDPTFGFWEKVFWFCIHVLAGSMLIVFLSDAWVAFVQQYFATTLYDPLYPIEWVPFPAVSICSNNRISLREAEKYAAELSKVDPDKANTTVFLERIKLLGWLYNRESFADTPDSYVFQQFLDLYGTGENESYYNTLDAMTRLTPPCAQLLLKCLVAGKEVDCLTNDTFKTTLTSYGLCCTFNHNDVYSSRKAKQRFAEPNLGLTVTLNTSSADMHFPILRTDGTVVLIHSATKFPDISSGGSSETFIINGDENFLSILPYVVDSVESIRQFSPKTRNCFFQNESPNVYKLGGLKYSFSNCVTRCRIKSIIVLCRCLPFNYPNALAPNETRMVYCTLRHLACLQRYRFKWKSVLSHRIVAPGLETEIEDALYCPHCLPSCDDITYEVFLNTLPLTDDLPYYDQNDVTVLRVYFAESYIKYYRQIVRNSWFEAFSTVGSYCGIVLGFSMIIIFEVVYFIGGQITLVLWQGMRNGHQALTIYP